MNFVVNIWNIKGKKKYTTGIQARKTSAFEKQTLARSNHNSGISNWINVLAIFCSFDLIVFWLQEMMISVAYFCVVPYLIQKDIKIFFYFIERTFSNFLKEKSNYTWPGNEFTKWWFKIYLEKHKSGQTTLHRVSACSASK